MPLKIFSAVLAVAMMLAFLTPIVFKLKEISLGVIISIGLAMMMVDLWQSLQSKED